MRVGALYAVLRLEKDQFDAALVNSGTKFSRFMSVIKLGAFVAAQAFLAVTAGSLFMAATFEQHMNESLAIMENVSSGMQKKMEEAARSVAKVTTFSANEAADAYYYLASAGYTAEQSIAALPTVAMFAQAGMMDLERATELLLDTQTTMGLRVEDAAQNMENMTRVSDVMSAAGIESNATLEQIAQSLTNKAGPAFRQVGKDIEEATAVLMVMANRGVKGQQAGTALAIVLRELQTKAIKNKEEFQKYGVAVFDASGEMRNMADIIGDLEGALEGLTDEQQKQALLGMGFTDRSVQFVQALLGTSEQIRKYEKDLREAGGTTQTVAEKQVDTLIGQLTIAWHKIQDVAISIGQKLIPQVTDIVRWVGNWVDANHDLIVQFVVDLWDAIGRTVRLIGRFVEHVRDAARGISNFLAPAVEFLGDKLEPVATFIGVIVRNLGDLERFAGHDSVFGKIGDAVVDANDALDRAAFWTDAIIRNLDDMERFTGHDSMFGQFARAWVGISDAIEGAVKYITEEAFPILEEGLVALGDEGLQYFTDKWTWLTDTVLPKLGELFGIIIDDILPRLGEGLNWVADEVLPKITQALGFINEEVVPLLMAAFEGILQWTIDNWPLIADTVGKTAGGIASAMTIMANIITFVVGVIWFVLEPLVTVLLPLLGGAFTALLFVVNFVVSSIGVLWQTFADAFGLIADSVINTIGFVADAIGGLVGIVQTVVDILEDFLGLADRASRVVINPGGKSGASGSFSAPNIYVPPPKPPTTTTYRIPPQLASGTSNFRGGMALIGERGPELMNLPAGAQVFGNARARGMMGGMGGEIHRHYHVSVNGSLGDVEEADDLLPTLRRLDYLEQMRRGNG
jgi:TP901 family phage tail tape measure protein